MKKIICLLVLAATFTLSTPFHYANAGGGGLATEATQWINRGFLFSIDKLTAELNVKERILDKIAWYVAKKVVDELTEEVRDFVAKGFEGIRPHFVTDLKRELLQQTDHVTKNFLQRIASNSKLLCSEPSISNPVLKQLPKDYLDTTIHEPVDKCTSNKIPNLEAFLNGDYTGGGGINALLETTSNAQNTTFGAYQENKAAMGLAIAEHRQQEKDYLDFNKGFLSTKIGDCNNNVGPNCEIASPGEVISEALQFMLSSDQQSLIQADEINEFLDGLLQKIFQDALLDGNNLLKGNPTNPPVVRQL